MSYYLRLMLYEVVCINVQNFLWWHKIFNLVTKYRINFHILRSTESILLCSVLIMTPTTRKTWKWVIYQHNRLPLLFLPTLCKNFFFSRHKNRTDISFFNVYIQYNNASLPKKNLINFLIKKIFHFYFYFRDGTRFNRTWKDNIGCGWQSTA